jgi:hypothetical protein
MIEFHTTQKTAREPNYDDENTQYREVAGTEVTQNNMSPGPKSAHYQWHKTVLRETRGLPPVT